MLQHLISLADHFDKNDKLSHANALDVFISRAQISNDEDTVILDPSYYESAPKDNDINDMKLPLNSGIMFDLESQLGLIILAYVNNAFKTADEGLRGGIVSVKDIRSIVDLAIRTNAETMEVFDSMDDNTNPIYPLQFRHILVQVINYVRSDYQPEGLFDHGTLRDLMETLYKNYEDKYLDDFMNLGGSHEDYMMKDKTIAAPHQEEVAEDDNLQGILPHTE